MAFTGLAIVMTDACGLGYEVTHLVEMCISKLIPIVLL